MTWVDARQRSVWTHETLIRRGSPAPTKSVRASTLLNLDGAFDSRKNRKAIFNRGMVPNIPENKGNRKRAKPGPKRLFNPALHTLRLAVERTFAWDDKFRRCLLRFERIQSRYMGFKLLASALINLRRFCAV